jgi:hypothetical protein
LGKYPAIGLKEARLARDQARTLVAYGSSIVSVKAMDLERMTPSQYFPASLRADNINVFALD